MRRLLIALAAAALLLAAANQALAQNGRIVTVQIPRPTSIGNCLFGPAGTVQIRTCYPQQPMGYNNQPMQHNHYHYQVTDDDDDAEEELGDIAQSLINCIREQHVIAALQAKCAEQCGNDAAAAAAADCQEKLSAIASQLMLLQSRQAPPQTPQATIIAPHGVPRTGIPQSRYIGAW